MIDGARYTLGTLMQQRFFLGAWHRFEFGGGVGI